MSTYWTTTASRDVRLLQVIREDFPAVLPLVETEGMSETGEPTREERQRLREAGILVPVTLGGKLFFPTSGGITTSGCMSAAVSECDRLLDALSNVEESLRDARRLREILERFAPAPPQLGAYKFKLLVAGRDFLLLEQNTQTRIPLFRMTFERK